MYLHHAFFIWSALAVSGCSSSSADLPEIENTLHSWRGRSSLDRLDLAKSLVSSGALIGMQAPEMEQRLGYANERTAAFLYALGSDYYDPASNVYLGPDYGGPGKRSVSYLMVHFSRLWRADHLTTDGLRIPSEARTDFSFNEWMHSSEVGRAQSIPSLLAVKPLILGKTPEEISLALGAPSETWLQLEYKVEDVGGLLERKHEWLSANFAWRGGCSAVRLSAY